MDLWEPCGMLYPGTDGRPGFASPAEQRLHFKTDWHRLNVKRRTAGHTPLSEDQFEAMLEGQHEASRPPDPHVNGAAVHADADTPGAAGIRLSSNPRRVGQIGNVMPLALLLSSSSRPSARRLRSVKLRVNGGGMRA